jgi:ABC-type dipeptide/oligopeptide/nickel transport system permease subunit
MAPSMRPLLRRFLWLPALVLFVVIVAVTGRLFPESGIFGIAAAIVVAGVTSVLGLLFL